MKISITSTLGSCDDFNQLLCCCNPFVPPFGRDGQRKAPSLWLFAVLAQDSLQLGYREGIDDLGRIQRLMSIHSHIEPRSAAKAEPPLPRFQLVRRDAQIQNNTIH